MSRISKDEFDKLTNTGKHKAITNAEERAEKAEKTLAEVWRNLLGAILAAKKPDIIIASVMKYADRHQKELGASWRKE